MMSRLGKACVSAIQERDWWPVLSFRQCIKTLHRQPPAHPGKSHSKMETERLRLEPYTVVPGACESTHPSARRPDAVWDRLIKLDGKGLCLCRGPGPSQTYAPTQMFSPAQVYLHWSHAVVLPLVPRSCTSIGPTQFVHSSVPHNLNSHRPLFLAWSAFSLTGSVIASGGQLVWV